MTDELRRTKLELGTLQSEFDELKYKVKNSKELPYKYAKLQLSHDELKIHKKNLDIKLRDNSKEEERLIIELAKLNIKLSEHEKS